MDVLLVGLGDLGTRILYGLARSSQVARLTAAVRNPAAARAAVAQAGLLADLYGGPEYIGVEAVDLNTEGALHALLKRIHPTVVVIAASRLTWWRPVTAAPKRAAELARLPYGAWLPVHADLVRRVMIEVRSSGVRTRTVALPFPDAVGPALRSAGLAPDIGAGNITEVAAKLRCLAASQRGVSRASVQVELVLHHSVERIAFSSFSSLAGDSEPGEEPPWYGHINVGDVSLPDQIVSDLLHQPYPLPLGVNCHELTAAAAVTVIEALLSPEPVRVHAPSPDGLPGGFPVWIGRDILQVALPSGLSLASAVRLNERAAGWDGIESIGADGLVTFTSESAARVRDILGMELQGFREENSRDVADEMLQRARRA